MTASAPAPVHHLGAFVDGVVRSTLDGSPVSRRPRLGADREGQGETSDAREQGNAAAAGRQPGSDWSRRTPAARRRDASQLRVAEKARGRVCDTRLPVTKDCPGSCSLSGIGFERRTTPNLEGVSRPIPGTGLTLHCQRFTACCGGLWRRENAVSNAPV